MTKEGYHWDETTEAAFCALKNALTTATVLGLPDFSKPFLIECDASGIGIGVVLTQEDRPIAYFSEALKGTVLALSTYEKEMLAVVKSVRKWRPYLLGKTFMVRTNQCSLTYLLEQRITTHSQARWLPKLLGYDYQVEYRKGRDNQAADSLSRVTLHFMSISKPQADWWHQLQVECQQDPFYSALSSNPHLIQPDGIWFYRGKVYLHPTSSILPNILIECHTTPTGRHFGFHKTLSRIRSDFYWPGMRQSVRTFLQECQTCQHCKSDNMAPAGLLQPLPILDRIWTEISMDFVKGLPLSNYFTVIMVVVYRLSKYAYFVLLAHPFTVITVAKSFVQNIVRLHGMPTSIVSDRDRIFLSNF